MEALPFSPHLPVLAPLSLAFASSGATLASIAAGPPDVPARTEPARVPDTPMDLGGELLASIPIETPFQLPFVHIRVNGSRPLRFLVDTGANPFLLDIGVLEEAGLEMPQMRGVDVIGGQVEAGSLPSVRVSIDELDLPSERFVVLPLAPLSDYVGVEVHGVLGYDFLERYVVDLDYEAHRIRFYKQGSVEIPPSFTEVSVSFDGHHATLPVRVIDAGGVATQSTVVLDTGSQEAFSFTRGSYDDAKFGWDRPPEPRHGDARR